MIGFSFSSFSVMVKKCDQKKGLDKGSPVQIQGSEANKKEFATNGQPSKIGRQPNAGPSAISPSAKIDILFLRKHNISPKLIHALPPGSSSMSLWLDLSNREANGGAPHHPIFYPIQTPFPPP